MGSRLARVTQQPSKCYVQTRNPSWLIAVMSNVSLFRKTHKRGERVDTPLTSFSGQTADNCDGQGLIVQSS